MARKKNPLIEQEQRKAQQEQLVKQAQAIATEEKQQRKTKLTLSLADEDITAVKKMAIDRKTTVSGLIHEWINDRLSSNT